MLIILPTIEISLISLQSKIGMIMAFGITYVGQMHYFLDIKVWKNRDRIFKIFQTSYNIFK